jgi:hypothetical protein
MEVNMFIEKWILATVAAIFVAVVMLLLRQGKQIRALRFCFMHFSDALKYEMDENKSYLDQPGGDVSAAIMKGFNRTWGSELDWARGVMGRAGLSWLSVDDKLYALEE